MSEPLPRATNWDESIRLLEGLPGLPLERRAEVIELLLRNPSPGVRERALRVGVAVIPDETIVEYLRCDADAALRNAALEIMKQRGVRSFQLAVELLRDADADVALQAVLILDHIHDPRAVEPLRATLHHANANVAQAAIVALGHLGDARTIADLLPFLQADDWLQVATVQALGDLRAAAAIAPLAPLLTHQLLGPLAAEAIAKVGGADAYRVLKADWLRRHHDLDPEISLGLLAHVVEGLQETPETDAELRLLLALRLRDPFRGVRLGAARCLLAMGPGDEDAEALGLLVAAGGDPDVVPSCLAHRPDLVARLLEGDRPARSWGLLLVARHPHAVDAELMAAAIATTREGDELTPLLAALAAVDTPELASPLLDLYLRLDAAERGRLHPLLARHAEAVAQYLDEWPMAPQDRIALRAALGRSAAAISVEILALPSRDRRELLPLLTDRPDVLTRLPWRMWLENEPELYTPLVAQIAAAAGLSELLPLLRERLRAGAEADAIRAVGELADPESAAPLAALLAYAPDSLLPLVAESLGKIGGREARRALRQLLPDDRAEVCRFAHRALGRCATPEDEPLFRQAAIHPDWCVRLAAAEVLARAPGGENVAALSQLAADPVSIVSHRALAGLRESREA